MGAKDFAEAGFLDDDGATGGEVTAAAVAEPAGVQPHILVLGDGELAFRAADVIAVKAIVGAEIVRGAEAPAVAQEFSARLVVLYVGGELERFAGAFGGGNEPKEFSRLAPQIFFAAPLDVFQAAGGPVRDGSEDGGG